MKKLKLLLLGILMFSFSPVFAGTIDYFDVTLSSDSTKVGEALDLTITAMDKDNNIVEDYLGTILVFSETDPKAQLPNVLNESSYTFSLSDAGRVKFENAVVFNSTGKQDLHVYDLNDDTDSVAGIVEVDVTKVEQATSSEEIEITSPETGTTLTSSSISVAGKTASNHRVILSANETDHEVISNSDGIFELTIDNLKDGNLTLIATVLNADEDEIGESDAVNIKITASAPIIKGITPQPAEGFPSYDLKVEIISEIGLEKVEMILNDSITTLTEKESGQYVAEIKAPDEIGEYPISVSLQNSLGVKSEVKNAATIKVIEEPKFNNEPTLDSGQDSGPAGKTEHNIDLSITGLKLTKLKTKSVLDWNTVEKADYYNVFIKDNGSITFVEKVTDPRVTVYVTGDSISYDDFVITAVMETNKDNKIEGDLSQATSIQTGPDKYMFILMAALIVALISFSAKHIIRQ